MIKLLICVATAMGIMALYSAISLSQTSIFEEYPTIESSIMEKNPFFAYKCSVNPRLGYILLFPIGKTIGAYYVVDYGISSMENELIEISAGGTVVFDGGILIDNAMSGGEEAFSGVKKIVDTGVFRIVAAKELRVFILSSNDTVEKCPWM